MSLRLVLRFQKPIPVLRLPCLLLTDQDIKLSATSPAPSLPEHCHAASQGDNGLSL